MTSEIHRFWRRGKLISHRLLPPGHYHVKLMKCQSDYKGRLQYHWDLIPYNPESFRSAHGRELNESLCS